MPAIENTYALTTLERVRLHLGPDAARSQGADTELINIINEVSAAMERECRRHFRSRTWTHDGTVLPRLDSCGGDRIWVANTPVTSVTTLKVHPTATALTEWNGTTGDFIVKAETGEIRLLWTGFYDLPRVVELTYVGGFQDSPATGREEWGWDIGAADIELACAQQVAWVYRGKDRIKEGVSSRSFEGVTTAYLTDAWLPEVKACLDRYRWENPIR